MRKSMVANFVPLGVFAFQYIRCAVGLFSNDEKRSPYIFLFQHVQNLGSPPAVRAIVKGQYEFVFGATDLLDIIGKRDGVVLFTVDQVSGLIVNQGAAPMFGDIRDAPDVAVAF